MIQLDEFKVGQKARLLCYYTPINKNFIEINWFYDDISLNPNNFNAELLDSNSVLSFKNLTQSNIFIFNFTNFTCQVKIKNTNQIIKSQAFKVKILSTRNYNYLNGKLCKEFLKHFFIVFFSAEPPKNNNQVALIVVSCISAIIIITLVVVIIWLKLRNGLKEGHKYIVRGDKPQSQPEHLPSI